MTEQTFDFRIVVEKPIAGAVYGLQKGSGKNYETFQKQEAGPGALVFDITLPAKRNKEGSVVLYGPFIQGTPQGRFLYLDIGSYAGQEEAPLSGRLKVPLPGISDEFSRETIDGWFFVAKIYGTDEKTGRPATGTVKPVDGWKIDK
ncbi:DUF5990 family protein [uncultured Fibrella sp.]|uniref:DUF5990 family protein n=1 Tax=uncultured Fibrella sp. TaxID=1284596 RepID=UPI0035CB81A8